MHGAFFYLGWNLYQEMHNEKLIKSILIDGIIISTIIGILFLSFSGEIVSPIIGLLALSMFGMMRFGNGVDGRALARWPGQLQHHYLLNEWQCPLLPNAKSRANATAAPPLAAGRATTTESAKPARLGTMEWRPLVRCRGAP